MRSTRISAAAIVATVLLAGVASADNHNRGHRLETHLTGAAERPVPGDADGSGTATVNPQPSHNQVCYTLEVINIDTAAAAHIHIGGPDVAGPVVVRLTAPSTGQSAGCVAVTEELARAIKENPENYYVNVHNAAFPGGAVRGQLED